MDISLYRMLPPESRDSVFVNSVPLMNIISHEIEDVIIDNGLKVDFYAGFQHLSNFTWQINRYRRLASVCRRVYIWGVPDIDPPAIPGVEYMLLSPEMALAREWFLVVDTPEFFTALLTQETDETYGKHKLKSERRYKGIWTYDSDLVSRGHLLLSQAQGGDYMPASRRNYEIQSRHLVQISNRLVQRQNQENGRAVLSQHHGALIKAGLSHIELPFLILDDQRTVVAASEATAASLNVPSSELTGKPLTECANGLFADLTLAAEETAFVHTVRMADGSTWSADGAAVLGADNRPMGWTVTLHPANSTNGPAVGGHSSGPALPAAPILRRYLGGIKQLLTMLPALAARQEVHQRVVSQMQRLVDDTNNVLDRLERLQTIEAQGLTARENVDLNALAQQVVAETEPAAQAQQVSLACQVTATVPPVQGDTEQIQLALRELLDNALRHARCQTITVQIAAQNGAVGLTVQDDGAGIDQGDLATLLAPTIGTAQDDSTTATRTGLGLPLARAVARAHNGQLITDSTVGTGSTFTLLFPL